MTSVSWDEALKHMRKDFMVSRDGGFRGAFYFLSNPDTNIESGLISGDDLVHDLYYLSTSGNVWCSKNDNSFMRMFSYKITERKFNE